MEYYIILSMNISISLVACREEDSIC